MPKCRACFLPSFPVYGRLPTCWWRLRRHGHFLAICSFAFLQVGLAQEAGGQLGTGRRKLLVQSFVTSCPIPPLGYFIHDTVDIVASGQARASWEYLVHHIMVREKLIMWYRPGVSNLVSAPSF